MAVRDRGTNRSLDDDERSWRRPGMPPSGYFTISNGIFKFNFLAVVVSEISGGSKFKLGASIIGFALKGRQNRVLG